MSGDWPLWMIGLMSTASFFFWWRLSLFLKTKYHVRAEYYFIWVMLSGPCYGFMTWVLFTFLYFSVGLGFQEFFDGLYFLIPNSIAVGGGFGILIGMPIGLVLAVLNFLVVQRKERRERQEPGSANIGRKILKIFLSIIIVTVIDLVCVWTTMYAWGDFGGVFPLFLFGGFLLLFVAFLVGVPIFKTTVPVIGHLFIFPVLFYISGSFYTTHLERQYDHQFHPLRETENFEILSEAMYRDEWGHGSGRHTQIKVFLVRCNQNAEELERVVRQQIDVDSLRKISDFSVRRRKNDSPMRRKDHYPIQMTVKKFDMSSVFNDPNYQQLKDKLGNNTEVLQMADYLLEFFYDVEPSGDY